MKADYVHKDTLTSTDYFELVKNDELLISYNQLLKENFKSHNIIQTLDLITNNYIFRLGGNKDDR